MIHPKDGVRRLNFPEGYDSLYKPLSTESLITNRTDKFFHMNVVMILKARLLCEHSITNIT